MRLNIGLKKCVFVIFVFIVIFNTCLIIECRNNSEKLKRTKEFYSQRVHELEKKIHDYDLGIK